MDASPAIVHNASLGVTLVYDVSVPGTARVFNAATGAIPVLDERWQEDPDIDRDRRFDGVSSHRTAEFYALG